MGQRCTGKKGEIVIQHRKIWLRVMVLLMALVNQLLQMNGCGLLPIDEEALQELVSLLLTAGAAVWVWLKR